MTIRDEILEPILVRAGRLTPGETGQLAEAWKRSSATALHPASWIAALKALSVAGIDHDDVVPVSEEARAAASLAHDPIPGVSRTAWLAVSDYAVAETASGLIALEMYLTLAGPWISVIGPS